APIGSTLGPGVYSSETSNVWTNAPGCGSGSTTAFDILSMERDASGVPLSIAMTFEFQCHADQYWPIVGAIRYNSSTPIASLPLPVGSPVFASVIAGQSGTPRSFSMTNPGDVAVAIGTVGVDGPE